MFKVINVTLKNSFNIGNNVGRYQIIRNFLSQAYYCQEVWDKRLNSPILQKVVPEEFYYELDQKFQKTKQVNALDVDIFANTIKDESLADELLDTVHKLRLTADTCNTLNSTSHAVVRALMKFKRFDDLLGALDDRLNYGLFVDYYTANLLMDTFWKSKQYAHGARVIGLLILQEELDHPLTCNFGLLHCYKYLLNPQGWPIHQPPPEPEEEVKIRVKYLRNPYNDDHFDLRDPNKIVGKILVMISQNKIDSLHRSFYILGLALQTKNKQLQEVCSNVKTPLYKKILDLVPEDCEEKTIINNLATDDADVEKILEMNVKKSFEKNAEQDISQQCQVFQTWEQDRVQAMEQQKLRLTTAKRLQDIDDLKKAMKEKEERLWFFENEEKIDLAIEAKRVYYPKRWFGNKKKPKKVDEGYVPPEIRNTNIDKSQIS